MNELQDITRTVPAAERANTVAMVGKDEPKHPRKALKVCLVGGDRRVRAMMENVFRQAGSEYFTLTDASVAEAAIANIDGDDSAAELRKHCKLFPRHYLLVLTFRKHEAPAGAIVLDKPVLLPRLLAALDWLRKKAGLAPREVSALDAPGNPVRNLAVDEMYQDEERTVEIPKKRISPPPASTDGQIAAVASARSIVQKRDPSLETTSRRPAAPVGPAPVELRDTNSSAYEPTQALAGSERVEPGLSATTPEVEEAAYLSIEGTLLESIRQAYQMSERQRVPVEVCSGATRLVMFDPETCKAFAMLQTKELIEMCSPRAPKGGFVVHALEPGTVDPDQAITAQRPEGLVFSIGLWTFDGKLPQETDIDHPVFLRYWPNFTRLPELPNAMRIAALWRKRATALSRTARELEIPQRQVFSFYAASWSLGMANLSRRSVDLILEPETLPQHSRRGLYERVVGHIDNTTQVLAKEPS